MAEERIVAVALLTQVEVQRLGENFNRLWPVDETPCFAGLIEAIDAADREVRQGRARDSTSAPMPRQSRRGRG